MAAQGNNEEAEELFRCSLAVREKVLGHDHPDVASGLNALAVLLQNEVTVDPLETCEVVQSLLGVECFGFRAGRPGNLEGS